MKMTPMAIACGLIFGASGSAWAAGPSEVEVLKQQMAALQQQMAGLQQKLDHMAAAPQAAAKPASDHSALSATIGGADVTLYGHADLSLESANNGKQSITQASSNLSYIGVKGGKNLGSTGLRAIFQIETLANISGTPTETGGLASRNSFVGLQGSLGSLMIGKTDTPYKRATGKMDPFSASVGDYNAIMGNTGGDLRAEFDARLPHSIWFDSAKMGGFSVNALYSPGQKLNNLTGAGNYAYPQGEKVCAGATPGASGSTPDGNLCDDGAFTNAYSLALNYGAGPLNATFAYEKHSAVDRTGDTGGIVSDESAAKLGLSYHFAIGNRLSGIAEKLYRDGGVNPALNERARSGYYLSDVQELSHGLDLMAAWAHAGKTPGGPDFGTADDKADMYSLGLKHHYDKQTSVYLVGAMLKNGPGAHYALGAGGHGVPIASPRDNSGATIPGTTEKSLSVGMQYNF
ncbi:major outer membrane protein P.IB precursor [mine drainage metagenome]|uniref:Major outer membrane protein P.IB n=1 Tax=mine drainage metagenome TaxID=410659 RepID=A0A1J5T4K7_9ZZZZ